MLIRSQDKLEIINMDNVERIMIIGNSQIAVQTVGDERWIIIGNYSTKEKVLDVLDVIEMDYMVNCKICNMPQEVDV